MLGSSRHSFAALRTSLDARSGEDKWKHEYDCASDVSYQAGPRCTPTVSGGKVYTLGTMGHLACLDAATGRPASSAFHTSWKAARGM